MLFTSGVGTSIIILGFLEPIYYVTTPPFHLEPFSRESYEFAHMYGQFHWGLSAWAFYSPAIVAVGHTIFNRKKKCPLPKFRLRAGLFPQRQGRCKTSY